MPSYHSLDVEAELSVLDALTASTPPPQKSFKRRDSDLDPLLLAAAFSSGPHVTRNHYAHDFFPAVGDPRAPGAWDWTKWTGEDPSSKQDPAKVAYVSRQAPRRQRLKAMGVVVDEEKEKNARQALADVENSERLGLPPLENSLFRDEKSTPVHERLGLPPSQELEVKCMARTRIPTAHGPAFLHLYHNNRDHKEHLAIVIDPAQLSSDTENPSLHTAVPPIRSRTLDQVWNPNETAMERITRGAYVGKLSSKIHNPSAAPIPHSASTPNSSSTSSNIPHPLVRIHSECFTGETIGSMRCDCGEQLDEAIRLISQPNTIPSLKSTPRTVPGRGVVVYLRQEGRGIGLLSKIRAYNLQDLGHDTVTANLMLGHKADERGYELAGAILRDLGLGGESVRLLTNNPDKVKALEKEGVTIAERVPMIPRSWRKHEDAHSRSGMLYADKSVTLMGDGMVHGQDLDKYLRTKVLRMGHMLPLIDHDDGSLNANGIVYL